MSSTPSRKPAKKSAAWTRLETPRQKFCFTAIVIIVLQLGLVASGHFIPDTSSLKAALLRAIIGTELLATFRWLWIMIKHPEVLARKGRKP